MNGRLVLLVNPNNPVKKSNIRDITAHIHTYTHPHARTRAQMHTIQPIMRKKIHLDENILDD